MHSPKDSWNRTPTPMPSSGSVGLHGMRPAGALLTQKEVARWLRVSLSSVRRYSAKGLLPRVKYETGPVRYRFEDVEEFIKSHVMVASVGSATYLPQRTERGS